MRGLVSSLNHFGDMGVDSKSAPEVLSRRVPQRRRVLVMMALSYVIDAIVLLVYAYAGTTSVTTGPLYLIASLMTIGCFTMLSDANINDHFKGPLPSSSRKWTVSISLMLAFIYIAPEVGCVFLCSLFVAFAFGSLRSTPWQNAISWSIVTLGLAILFLSPTRPIAMPAGSQIERFATMLVFMGCDWPMHVCRHVRKRAARVVLQSGRPAARSL